MATKTDSNSLYIWGALAALAWWLYTRGVATNALAPSSSSTTAYTDEQLQHYGLPAGAQVGVTYPLAGGGVTQFTSPDQDVYETAAHPPHTGPTGILTIDDGSNTAAPGFYGGSTTAGNVEPLQLPAYPIDYPPPIYHELPASGGGDNSGDLVDNKIIKALGGHLLG